MPDEQTTKLRLEIAHVLFIDIVGYSKLRLHQQAEALRQLNQIVSSTEEFREADAQRKLIRLPTGDGAALVFRTNIEAPAQCALQIAEALKSHPHIELRMGIHSGPVSEVIDVNQHVNIAGAGINLAQRVMDCGDAGHILVSRRVAEDLEQDDHWQPFLRDVGECEVKHGIRLRLVNLYTDDLGNPEPPRRCRANDASRPIISAAEQPSIAVLPFADLSQMKDQEYFCDGISEEILNSLARVQGLSVAARTSSFSFKGKNVSVNEVASRLHVEHILEGSLRRDGDRVRINVQLVNGRDGFQRWSATYERELQDVFALQDEITRAVVDALKIRLAVALPAQTKANTEAYDLYLKGRFCWNKRTTGALKKAIGYFKRAIEKQPDYALAYTGLSDCYSSLGCSFDAGSLSPREAVPKARAAALKASQIDDRLAETHTSLAFIKLNYDWDWHGAEEQFQRAIQLNPNYDNAHHWYSHYLLATGRTKESLTHSYRALELDRVGSIINLHLGWHYLYANEVEPAIEQFGKTLDLDPGYGLAHWYLGQAFNRSGMFGKAFAHLKKAKELLKEHAGVEAEIAFTHAVAGKQTAAKKILRQLQQLSQKRYVSPYHFALIECALGNPDQAFIYLDRACEDRSDLMVYLGIDTRLDPLRPDPRFSQLLQRLGLPIGANVAGQQL